MSAAQDWMRIGGGNFGNVYRAQYGATVVAVKELNKPDPNNPEDDDMGIYYQREVGWREGETPL